MRWRWLRYVDAGPGLICVTAGSICLFQASEHTWGHWPLTPLRIMTFCFVETVLVIVALLTAHVLTLNDPSTTSPSTPTHPASLAQQCGISSTKNLRTGKAKSVAKSSNTMLSSLPRLEERRHQKMWLSWSASWAPQTGTHTSHILVMTSD